MTIGVSLVLLVCTLPAGKAPECVAERTFGPNKTIEDCLITALSDIPNFPTADGKHLGGVYCKSEVRDEPDPK